MTGGIAAEKLPQKYVGLSHCFRTEAGAPGRDTRGLYRVPNILSISEWCLPQQLPALPSHFKAVA